MNASIPVAWFPSNQSKCITWWMQVRQCYPLCICWRTWVEISLIVPPRTTCCLLQRQPCIRFPCRHYSLNQLLLQTDSNSQWIAYESPMKCHLQAHVQLARQVSLILILIGYERDIYINNCNKWDEIDCWIVNSDSNWDLAWMRTEPAIITVTIPSIIFCLGELWSSFVKL